MSQQLLPPDIRRIIQSLEQRIAALEQRLRITAEATADEIIFTLPGSISATQSPPVKVRNTSPLLSVVGNLGTAGTTTTVVDVYRGTQVVVALSFAPGVKAVKVPAAVRYGADQELLSVKVRTAGTNARDLTVQTRFN